MSVKLPTPETPLRIGTRGSPLALAQAHETRARLMQAHSLPEAALKVVVITTTGDRVQDRPLKELGGKGLFTKEIEEAMYAGEIDLAVHSTKDMPTEQPPGLTLGCFLPREDPRDAFVSLRYKSLSEMPEGAVVGTSSLRRKAQLLARFPHLRVVEFRGSVQTRLQKLEDGVADATFLAMAGLSRLGTPEIAQPIAPEEMLPAVAQGAIGIEYRSDDETTAALLSPLHDAETGTRLAAERAFLAALDGSCETPIAGLAEVTGAELTLRGELIRPDGSEVLTGIRSGPLQEAAQMGADLGMALKERAGPDFLKV